MITDLLSSFDALTGTKLFQDFGLIFLFFIASSPSIMFIPDEVFMFPLVSGGAGWFSILLVVAGGHFMGDIILYYLGHHADRLVKGNRKQQTKAKHWLHKYKHIVFLIVPFTSVVGDLILVYAGIKHIPLKSFWWILLPSVVARAILSMVLLYGLISLPI